MVRISAGELGPSQLKFLQSRATNSLFAGGFGAGKSLVLRFKAIQLKGDNGNLPGLLMARTHGSLFANIVDPLMQIYENTLPKRHVPRIVTDNKGRKQLRYSNGSIVYLRSAEKLGSFDGLDVAWFCGDELRHWSRKAYDIAIARVRMKAARRLQRCWASTPSIGHMSDNFNSGKSNYELITCGTIENIHNLAPGYIDDLRSSYSPLMQRAVLEGEFAILEGACFEQFDPKPESDWFVDFDPDVDLRKCQRVYLAVDPGFNRSAWLWVAERVVRNNLGESHLEWVVFHEMMPEKVTDTSCVDMVNAHEKWLPDEVWCDPAADNTQSVTGTDTILALREIKCRMRGRNIPVKTIAGWNRDIVWGIDKMRVMLGGYEGLPIRIKFARRLLDIERPKQRGIIKDLSSLRYQEMKDGRPISDKPLKDGLTDHTTDALRYLVCGLCVTVPELRKKNHAALRNNGAGFRVA